MLHELFAGVGYLLLFLACVGNLAVLAVEHGPGEGMGAFELVQLAFNALAQTLKAGCETIYQQKVSGASASRPELERLLTQLRSGDTVYIYKLDRLGRSLRHLLKVVGDLPQPG
jgi:hypothetical protein